MKQFSKFWIASKKPSKQRKYVAQAPLHLRKKFMGAHLSRELRDKYKKRSLPIRKGDKVKILRGAFVKKEGKVERVNRKKIRVFISGIERVKKDGTKVLVPIHPSNLLITELNLEDKRRLKRVAK